MATGPSSEWGSEPLSFSEAQPRLCISSCWVALNQTSNTTLSCYASFTASRLQTSSRSPKCLTSFPTFVPQRQVKPAGSHRGYGTEKGSPGMISILSHSNILVQWLGNIWNVNPNDTWFVELLPMVAHAFPRSLMFSTRWFQDRIAFTLVMEWPQFVWQLIYLASSGTISNALLGQRRFLNYHLYEPKEQNQNKKKKGKKGYFHFAHISRRRSSTHELFQFPVTFIQKNFYVILDSLQLPASRTRNLQDKSWGKASGI